MPKKNHHPNSFSVPGMQITRLVYKRSEDEEEKAWRLHKERLSFYVKEIGTYVLAFWVMALMTVYCCWAIFDRFYSGSSR